MSSVQFCAAWVRACSCGDDQGRQGQAMVEYLIVAATLILAVAVLAVFLFSFRENSSRVLDLVASDYP